MAEPENDERRPKESEPAEQLLAVRPREDAAEGAFGDVLDPERLGLPPRVIRALRQGGWLLAVPTESARVALRGRRLPAGAREALWAHRAGKDLALASWRCTLRVDEERARLPDRVARELAALGLEVLRRYRWMGNGWSVRIPYDRDPRAFAAGLVADHGDLIVAAEPEWLRPMSPRYEPRGPLYHYQWQWRNREQSGGKIGADVAAEQAWKITRGKGTRIAVIDFGFQVDHVDLEGVAVEASGHFDSGGTGTFEAGVAKVSTATATAAHGTACAALAAGRPRRRRGLTGIAPKARLLLLSLDPLASPEMLGRAFAYAADPREEVSGSRPKNGADVISCSVAPDFDAISASDAADLKSAVEFVESTGRGYRGTVLAWAVPGSSAALAKDVVAQMDTVLAVGMTTNYDEYGGHGKGKALDLVAPGITVYMSRPLAAATDWGFDSGTSFAAPIVAGVAALAISVNHTLSAAEVRGAILTGCDRVGALPYVGRRNDTFGFGRVNAVRAVKHAIYAPP